ncbi:hypothetical protein [Mucilaginibacter sp. HD30]
MKTLKLTLAILLFAICANAQSGANYLNAMKKGLTAFQSDSSSAQLVQSANYFERIALAESKEWLPLYYAGYCNLLVAIDAKQPNQKDALYDKAMDFAQKADKLSPKNSEIATLMGYVTFMKMAVDPTNRAMNMMGEASGYLDLAIALNPENPRPYFVKGQNTFYMPIAFGGGSANAKPLFVKALEKYAKENITGIEPSWGKERCQVLLSQCK